MNSDNNNVDGVKYRILIFYCILVLDLLFTSFIELSFQTNLNNYSSVDSIIVLIIQLFLSILTIIWLCVILWKTVLFQFGMLGTIFNEFKLCFLFYFLYMILFGIERGLKYSYNIQYQQNSYLFSYQQQIYQVFFYFRFLFYSVYLYIMINAGLKIADPVYYKIEKWIK